MEAREFGEKLCEKTATDWAAAQLKDETSKIAVEYILAGVSIGNITEEMIPETVDKKEVKRLVSQGELMALPNSQKLLVKRLSIEPANSDDRNPGRFERFLGEEPVRTYVPLLLRPWVMDCAHKESVHLGLQLARVVMVAEDAESKKLPHTVRLLDLGKRYNVHLAEEKLTTVSEKIKHGVGMWT